MTDNLSDFHRFVDLAERRGIRVNGLVVRQGGDVVFERYGWPNTPDTRHLLFSATKSITATAIGVAYTDGLLDLSARLVDLLPDDVPDRHDPNLEFVTVEDLLTMRSGRATGLHGPALRRFTTGWLQPFMEGEFPHTPGTEYVYCSGSSQALSAIVNRLYSKPAQDVLEERIFEPLGFGSYDWSTDPAGQTTGGNGLRLRLSDLAKWAQLHLNLGTWDGKQLLAEDWVQAATRPHVVTMAEKIHDGSDLLDDPEPRWAFNKRYGYHLWCGPRGSYYTSGAYGQVCLVVPELDAVAAVAVSGGKGLGRFWAAELYRTLHDQLPRIELRPAVPTTYTMEDHSGALETVTVELHDDDVRVRLREQDGAGEVIATPGRKLTTTTSIPTKRFHSGYEYPDAEVGVNCHWTRQNTLTVEVQFAGTPYTDLIDIDFLDDGIRWTRSANVAGTTVVAEHLWGAAAQPAAGREVTAGA